MRWGIICFVLIPVIAAGQPIRKTLELDKVEPIPGEWLLLLQPNEYLKQDALSNERVLDLVDITVVDDSIGNRMERHRFPSGRILRLLGWNWQPINGRKEKFVGTAVKHVRIPDKEFLSEYDINWDLSSRLSRYFRLAYHARQQQIALDRRMKGIPVDRPPFTYPENDSELNRYTLHCEWTPKAGFRKAVDQKFFPCLPGSSMDNHPNFGENHVGIGLYGAYCLDCNHSCHPEIHPYEWIWWLNLHPDEASKPNTKTWLFGLVVEGSKRFPKWSPGPRSGTISIPFIFPVNAKVLSIHLEHLVYGSFNPDGFAQIIGIPELAEAFTLKDQRFGFKHPDLAGISLKLTTSSVLHIPALKFWFDELTYDAGRGLIYGRLNLATSVDDLYTARLSICY